MRPLFFPVFLFLTLLAQGCLQQEAPPAPPLVDSGALMQSYRELATAKVEELDVTSAHAIVQRLQQTPEGLTPLFELLGDPEASPVAKLLTVISLTPFLNEEMAPQLLPLTEPGQDATTRACATHLLGRLPVPAAQERVRELLDDPVHQVQAAAMMVLGAMRDPVALERLPTFWRQADTTDEDRDQILLMVPEEHVAQHPDLYSEALLNHALEPKSRERLAAVFGRVGSVSNVAMLEQAAAEDPSPEVRVMARGAIDAIQARAGGSNAGTAEEPSAADVSSPLDPPAGVTAVPEDVPASPEVPEPAAAPAAAP